MGFTKSVVKSSYSAGILFDVMQCFGEVTPEVAHYRKYAKMKAAYIHNCLKNGETTVAGPLVEEDEEEDIKETPEETPQNPSIQPSAPASNYVPPQPTAASAPAPAPAISNPSATSSGSSETNLSYD